MGLPCALLGMGRGDEGSYQVQGVWVGVLSAELGRESGDTSGVGADTVGGREVSAHVPRPRRVNGGRDR